MGLTSIPGSGRRMGMRAGLNETSSGGRGRPGSTRQLRLLLFSIGLGGLAIGAAFIIGYLVRGNPGWAVFGVVYLLLSAGVLCMQRALFHIANLKRRKGSGSSVFSPARNGGVNGNGQSNGGAWGYSRETGGEQPGRKQAGIESVP